MRLWRDGKYGVLSTQMSVHPLHNPCLMTLPKVTLLMICKALFIFLFLLSATVTRSQDLTGMFDSGMRHFERGEYRHAVSFFTGVVEYDSGHLDALMARGKAYSHLAMGDKALSDFSRVLSLRPGHADALLERGGAHLLMGETSRACDDWQAASSAGAHAASELIDLHCKN